MHYFPVQSVPEAALHAGVEVQMRRPSMCMYVYAMRVSTNIIIYDTPLNKPPFTVLAYYIYAYVYGTSFWTKFSGVC